MPTADEPPEPPPPALVRPAVAAPPRSPGRGAPAPLLQAYGPDALYVYAFAGRPEDGFHLGDVDEADELGTALPLTFAGRAGRVTCAARCVTPALWSLMADDLRLPLCPRDAVVPFPAELRADIGSDAWFTGLAAHLRAVAAPRSVVMAQPLLDPELAPLFRIDPRLSARLNDKLGLTELVPAAAPPPRLATFADGASLAGRPWPGPCLVKVSGSCGGAGVFPCREEAAWAPALAAVARFEQPVLVERWVVAQRNLDVEFLLPADRSRRGRVIDAVEQVVGPGERLAGGVCRPPVPSGAVPDLFATLEREILPALRSLGWHGVGGFDVLVDGSGSSYFIDPNLRITDFTAALLHNRRGPADRSTLILLDASFDGGVDAFRRHLAPLAREGAPDQLLAVHAMLDLGNRVLLHGGLLYRGVDALRAGAARLKAAGLRARALDLVETVATSACMGG